MVTNGREAFGHSAVIYTTSYYWVGYERENMAEQREQPSWPLGIVFGFMGALIVQPTDVLGYVALVSVAILAAHATITTTETDRYDWRR